MDPEKQQRTQKQKLQWHWYIGSFVVISFVSYVVPVAVLYFYLRDVVATSIYTPLFSTWEVVPTSATFSPLKATVFYTIPLVLLGLYLLNILLTVLVGKGLLNLSERASPARKGVFQRTFEHQDDYLYHYHYRGFLYRFLKWKVTKCLFPWLTNWAWNFVGGAKIGKGVTLEDHYLGAEFLEVGDDAYIGLGTIVGTHTVEGVFGRVVITGSRIGRKCTVGPKVVIGPDSDLADDSHVLSSSGLGKAYKLRAGGYYQGRPVIKFTRGKVKRFFEGRAWRK
ncbi:MAG: hypothetical protein ACTSU5_06365 [Promethearchaeota archaeon]